jgi:serine phosphatase RsbU (regulator of sigma subunit)
MEVKDIQINDHLKLQADYDAVRAEMEGLKLYFSELEATNNHLISATWREREMKRKLADTIDELNQTKLIVENQNKRITESINYSKKIQQAINPTENDFYSITPESFVMYLPKDVISGDFPWMFKHGEYTYLAAADCTGHGVPGAMMSMIGNLLLNDIVNDKQILMPSVILRKLHEAVVYTLKQDTTDSNSNDGMDIGLCCIDHKNKQLFYSGAHRPMFFMRNGAIEVISGDKFPIGGMHYKNLNKFTDKVIDIKEGDSIFLFTDGLPDQTGGENKMKLMSKNIKNFIELHATLKMQELKESMLNYFHTWKGTNKQIDDVLLIGLRF